MTHTFQRESSTGIQTYGAIIDVDDRYRIPASLSSTTFPYCSYGVVSCTWPNGASSFGTGWLFGPNDVATIAVLPATYQSERDETKDYAFLSLNYNYLLKYQI